jgi:hypothetical protein
MATQQLRALSEFKYLTVNLSQSIQTRLPNPNPQKWFRLGLIGPTRGMPSRRLSRLVTLTLMTLHVQKVLITLEAISAAGASNTIKVKRLVYKQH